MISKRNNICCGNFKLGLCFYNSMLYCCTSYVYSLGSGAVPRRSKGHYVSTCVSWPEWRWLRRYCGSHVQLQGGSFQWTDFSAPLELLISWVRNI